ATDPPQDQTAASPQPARTPATPPAPRPAPTQPDPPPQEQPAPPDRPPEPAGPAHPPPAWNAAPHDAPPTRQAPAPARPYRAARGCASRSGRCKLPARARTGRGTTAAPGRRMPSGYPVRGHGGQCAQ